MPNVPAKGGEWVNVLVNAILLALFAEATTFVLLVKGRSVAGLYLLKVMVY